MGNTITLKTINELCIYSFYVPAFQRGYRWTEQQVIDLLNDINEFSPKEIPNKEEKTWYCLQPIVVKKSENDFYHVIDGQQRLTTLYLILHYLNQDFFENKRDKLYSIDYETRKETKNFLSEISSDTINDSNIDFYYISKVFSAIIDWFENQENTAFDRNNFRSKLKYHTKVIWYECDEENLTNVFTRLNIGKISLTNSELIKALFLNNSNFSKNENESIYLRQLEITNEWDFIENKLQNDRFWFFLNNENKEDTRIDFIFDLMKTEDNNEINDNYATFRYFYNQLKNKDFEIVKEYWEKVQKYFQRLNEWFENRELYHLIGFIITNANNNNKYTEIKKLCDKSFTLKKSEFRSNLKKEIKSKFNGISFSDLYYGSPYIKEVLLLYNILTMLQNDSDFSYFPFDLYKNQKWNIEHINSIKEATNIPEEYQETRLKDIKNYIDTKQQKGKELSEKIDNYLAENKNPNENSNNPFEKLFGEIIDYFDEHIQYDKNYISNLALLDERTNKGYKNAIFPIKRKWIINLDKSGGFVPLCTKKVFLKYVNDTPSKISFWTDDDREKYEEDLKHILEDYIQE